MSVLRIFFGRFIPLPCRRRSHRLTRCPFSSASSGGVALLDLVLAPQPPYPQRMVLSPSPSSCFFFHLPESRVSATAVELPRHSPPRIKGFWPSGKLLYIFLILILEIIISFRCWRSDGWFCIFTWFLLLLLFIEAWSCNIREFF